MVFGSPARTRTTDPVINSHLLYRLSYRGNKRTGILFIPASSVNVELTLNHVPDALHGLGQVAWASGEGNPAAAFRAKG